MKLDQKELVKEITNLFQQKLELLKSQVSGEQAMFQAANGNEPLSKLQNLPLEDPKIYAMISYNFEVINQIRDIFTQKVENAQLNEIKYRTKLSSILGSYSVFKKAIDQLVKKNLPKCKKLL